MRISRLGSVAIRLADRNLLFPRLAVVRARSSREIHSSRSTASKRDDDDDIDKPIKFTSSKAAAWKAEYSRTGGPDDTPKHEGTIVAWSTIVFLIYFCALREENDVDEKLSMNLVDHFQGERRRNLEITMELADKIAEEHAAAAKK